MFNIQKIFLSIILFYFLPFLSYSQCEVERDSLALVALYNLTDGPNWTNSWNLSTPIKTWYGVEVNVAGCVICLDMDGVTDCSSSVSGLGNNLIGIIPSQLRQLTELNTLVLSDNMLSGSIPSIFRDLTSLNEVNLSNNLLTGELPTNLENLSALRVLDLSSNELSGCIPDGFNIFCTITSFDLQNNQRLPWEGDTTNFCNGTSQTAAACDDGNSMTSGDRIDPCCNCNTNPACDNDMTGPDLSNLIVPPVMEFCPGQINRTQAVLDQYFGGTYAFLEQVTDNCTTNINDYEINVTSNYFTNHCGDTGFIEWEILDHCGNVGVNSPVGGGLFRVEWTIGVSPETSLDWISPPSDFLPLDITISTCSNDFDPCIWMDENMNMWVWEVMEGIHWSGGCEVTVEYSHVPCAAAQAAQNFDPLLIDVEDNENRTTTVCVTLSDSCDGKVIEYCFNITTECSGCNVTGEVFCSTCEEANVLQSEGGCKICDPEVLTQGYESCTPACPFPCFSIDDGSQPSPLCGTGGVPNNMSWFAFVASSSRLDINVEVSNCKIGLGVQLGIYDSCSWDDCVIWSGDSDGFGCIVDSSWEGSGFFNPGQTYYLFVDGCNGDECMYKVIIEGLTFLGLPEMDAVTAYSVCRDMDLTSNPDDPNFGGIQSGSVCDINDAITVCPGERIQFGVVHKGNPDNPIAIHQDECNFYSEDLSANFIWEVSWEGSFEHNPVEDRGLFLPELQAPSTPSTPGNPYTVCLNFIDLECDPKIGPVCLDVYVVPTDDEVFIHEVCVEDLEAGWFPEESMQDPNGDGEGWLGDFLTLAEVDSWPVSTSDLTEGYRCQTFLFLDSNCLCEVPQTMCIKVVGDRDKSPIELFMYRCQFEECNGPLDCDSEAYEWAWDWNGREETFDLYYEDDVNYTESTCFRISEYHTQMDSWRPQGEEYCDSIPFVSVFTRQPPLSIDSLGCGAYVADLDFSEMAGSDWDNWPKIMTAGTIVEYIDCSSGNVLPGSANGLLQLASPNSNVCIRVFYSFEDGAWWDSDEARGTHGSGQPQFAECSTTWGPFDFGLGQPAFPEYSGDDTFCATNLESHLFEVLNPSTGFSYVWNQNPVVPGVVVNDVSVVGDGTRVELTLPSGWGANDCTNVVAVAPCGTSNPTPVCFTLEDPPTVVVDPITDICVTDASDANAVTVANVSATATPAGNYCYTWANGGSNTVTITNSTSFNFASAGTQLVTVSVEDKDSGCSSIVSAPVSFEVIEPLDVPIVSCGSRGLDFVEFNWTTVPGANNYTVIVDGIVQTETGTIFRVDGLTLGQTVTVTVIANGNQPCFSSASSAPLDCTTTDCPADGVVQSFNGESLCLNDPNLAPYSLDDAFDVTATGGTIVYTTTPAGAHQTGNIFNPLVAAPGTYTITAEYTYGASNNCFSNFRIQYILLPAPVADFTIASPVCQRLGAELDVSNITGTSSWDYDGGIANANGEIEWAAGGRYTVSVEANLAGCVETFEQMVVVEPALEDIFFEPCDSGLDFVIFNWNDVPDATGYELVITNQSAGMTTTETVQNSEYQIIELNENDNIELVVTALSSLAGCESSASNNCSARSEGTSNKFVATTANAFSFYPNPTSDKITLLRHSDLRGDTWVRIYSIQQKLILRERIVTMRQEIDLSSYPPGIYFMQVREGDRSYVNRIIKL